MTEALFEPEPAVDVETLRKIHLRQKPNERRANVAIAHGLAYNPHVDGKLRLTPRGREHL